MPPPPEFLDGLSEIGRIKVFRQIDAQHFRRADGHIGVARKVAVDLQGIDQSGEHQEDAGIALIAAIDRIDEDRRPVRNAELQEKAPGQDQEAPAQLGKVRLLGLLILGQQLVAPADRAGEDLRKEGDKQCKPQKILFRLVFAFIDVDQVPRRLEGEKGDTRGL